MNLKLFSCLLILLISGVSLISAHGQGHGHSHDGDDHHHHSHEDVKPSFKYSRQANEEVKPKENHESHNHHGHSHGEPHHDHHHDEKPKLKEAPAGYSKFLSLLMFLRCYCLSSLLIFFVAFF